MKIVGDLGTIELERRQLPESGDRDDDLLLGMSVQLGPYSAADESWVTRGDWNRFRAELTSLVDRRQGEAALLGADPKEFSLVLFSTDSAGHMALRGCLSWQRLEGYRQTLSFSTPFDVEFLTTVAEQLLDLERAE